MYANGHDRLFIAALCGIFLVMWASLIGPLKTKFFCHVVALRGCCPRAEKWAICRAEWELTSFLPWKFSIELFLLSAKIFYEVFHGFLLFLFFWSKIKKKFLVPENWSFFSFLTITPPWNLPHRETFSMEISMLSKPHNLANNQNHPDLMENFWPVKDLWLWGERMSEKSTRGEKYLPRAQELLF